MCSRCSSSSGASRHMISIASWSPRKSDPLTVSYACDSHVSSGFSAALIPPAAATVVERTVWTLLMIATVSPSSAAASAARWPARPAPMIRTSWAGMASKISCRGCVRSRPHGAPHVRLRRARSQFCDRLGDRCSFPAVPVRVMIVDDHADVRFLIRAIVEDADEDVTVAGVADGVRAALESIDRLDPDVVVLDSVMPVITGIQAAPMILARRPGQKILLCSALVD